MTGNGPRRGRRQRPRPSGREPYGRGEPTPGGRPRFPWAGGGPPLRGRPAPASRGQRRLTGRGRAVRVQQWTAIAGPRGSQAGTKGGGRGRREKGVAAGEEANSLIRSSGQGRGRTADLPLFSLAVSPADLIRRHRTGSLRLSDYSGIEAAGFVTIHPCRPPVSPARVLPMAIK